MKYEEWFKYFDGDKEAIDTVYRLKKETPYTDENIMEAIDKIGEVYFKVGATKKEIVYAIYASELMTLR